MFEYLRLSDLPRGCHHILRSPSSTRPALWLVEENGVRAVVKDYSRHGFLYRHFIARFLIWREVKAYRRLRGLNGVPTFYRAIAGPGLVLEEISGRSLEGLEAERKLPEAFFKELEVLVEKIHERGLAHCDLKRAPNVLVGDDGRPYIVDWSSAVTERELRFLPLRAIYRRFLQDDFNAVTKLRRRHCPWTVSPERMMLYSRRSPLERLVRSTRDRMRALLQRIA